MFHLNLDMNYDLFLDLEWLHFQEMCCASLYLWQSFVLSSSAKTSNLASLQQSHGEKYLGGIRRFRCCRFCYCHFRSFLTNKVSNDDDIFKHFYQIQTESGQERFRVATRERCGCNHTHRARTTSCFTPTLNFDFYIVYCICRLPRHVSNLFYYWTLLLLNMIFIKKRWIFWPLIMCRNIFNFPNVTDRNLVAFGFSKLGTFRDLGANNWNYTVVFVTLRRSAAGKDFFYGQLSFVESNVFQPFPGHWTVLYFSHVFPLTPITPAENALQNFKASFFVKITFLIHLRCFSTDANILYFEFRSIYYNQQKTHLYPAFLIF